MKKPLQIVLKVVVACAVLALVLHKAEPEKILAELKSISPGALGVSLALVMIAHVIAALRMRVFLRPLHMHLSPPYACKLYFIGSLFNLILPTGVGGDAIKAWAIRKQYDSPMKPIIKALILDRASGLLVICLIVLGYMMTVGSHPHMWLVLAGTHIPFAWLAWVGIPVTIGAYFFIARKFFGQRTADGIAAFGYSLASQALWCAVIVAFARALGGGENASVYVFLYAVAGIVSLVPVTIGGLGLREGTFYVGATWLAAHTDIAANAERGVAISLAYFAIYIVSSGVGALATAAIRAPQNLSMSCSIKLKN